MTKLTRYSTKELGQTTRIRMYGLMEKDMMKSTRTPNSFTPLRTAAACMSALGLAAVLTGCGMTGSNTKSPVGSPGSPLAIHVSGNVHGGQQPVSGSTIQLYAVGTGGVKTASSPLVSSTVTTDANGNWDITGLYTCPSASAQVYVTATGGNPGAGNNASLTLAAALGSCGNLSAATYVIINEVTSVAAAYALAPFAADITHIGATGVGTAGITGAFANAAVLANFANGQAPGAGLPAGTTVPVSEINTLADILASCVNTTGASSTACTTLFNATAASDTFGAALAIAKNPGAPSVTALYTLSSAMAPFQPSMTGSSAPNDYTIAVTSTAGGVLATPYGIAIDAAGNAWVTNEAGTTVTELSATTLLQSANATVAGMYGPQGVAIDKLANVWVANTAGNSVVKIPSATPNAGVSYTAGGVTGPTGIATDSANNVFVANFNGNSVTELTNAGAAASGSPFTGSSNNISLPQAVAVGADRCSVRDDRCGFRGEADQCGGLYGYVERWDVAGCGGGGDRSFQSRAGNRVYDGECGERRVEPVHFDWRCGKWEPGDERAEYSAGRGDGWQLDLGGEWLG